MSNTKKRQPELIVRRRPRVVRGASPMHEPGWMDDENVDELEFFYRSGDRVWPQPTD